MRSKSGRRTDDGLAVVAVMVLIAILFLSGTVMALAVSSNLRTVDLTSRQDAVHYAAESAVARAAAAGVKRPGCVLTGSINRQDFTANCQPQLDNVAPDSVPVRSDPGRYVATPASLAFPLSLPTKWEAVWAVIGWRASDPSAAVFVWIDGPQGCDAQPSLPSSSPVYVVCQHDEAQEGDQQGQADNSSPVLHVTVRGGPIALGSFVVRAALEGQKSIVTVVGRSGIEVDEADVALPAGRVRFWNTVLP